MTLTQWTDAKLAILPSVDSVAQRHAQLCFGWVAERLIAAVLKTVNPKGFVGSTPTPAAMRSWRRGSASAFQADDMGSIPIERSNFLDVAQLVACSPWKRGVAGSSPAIQTIIGK